MSQVLPNFFLIGAPKCGTTALARYLAQHPSVYMSPVKEPCFFAPEVVHFDARARAAFDRDATALQAYLDGPMRELRPHGIVTDWSNYLKLFKHVTDETAIGEASVSYFASLGAPHALRARVPFAKLFAVLRDPADRLFSHYAAARASGATERPFLEWMDEQLALELMREPRAGVVWAGYYGAHLQRYLGVFPAAQIRTYLYEHYVDDPVAVLRDIFEFLGVSAGAPIDASARHNVTTIPKWPRLERAARPVTAVARVLAPRVVARARRWTRAPVGLSPAPDERARAVELYAEDIQKLGTLTGCDLSAWLR